MGASIEASLRRFSLRSTRAVCPTLRRLGTLVEQDPVCDWAGVASCFGSTVGVAASGTTVAGSVALEVGVAAGAPGVVLGFTAAGTGEAVMIVSVAAGDGSVVSVTSTATPCVGAGAAGLVAHPRSSMSSRIAARRRATIVLNRSYAGAVRRFMACLISCGQGRVPARAVIPHLPAARSCCLKSCADRRRSELPPVRMYERRPRSVCARSQGRCL